MPVKFKFTDEADAVAHIEGLNTQIAGLKSDLASTNASLEIANASATSRSLERDKARTDLAAAQSENATLTTERDTLNTGNASLVTENAALKADMSDFNKRVAADLARHGIRAEAAKTGTAAGTPAAKQTVSQICEMLNKGTITKADADHLLADRKETAK